MAAKEKVLWVVNCPSLDSFLGKADDVGATGVAIRTDNDVPSAIAAGHLRGLKVYGWRWPSTKPDKAMEEAHRAAALFGQGLDGYFTDPEQSDTASLNWDDASLASLADEFCSTIVAAAGDKPFGVTSHGTAESVAPNLPWTTFFKYATVLLPQAYWRSTGGVIKPGTPEANYVAAVDAWTKAGGVLASIVPMAGELGVATGGEITEYALTAKSAAVDALHFYAFQTNVADDVWTAISSS
jgi:hypothetical protein